MIIQKIKNDDIRYLYERIYMGDYGAFFDPIGCGAYADNSFSKDYCSLSDNNIFCQLFNIIKSKADISNSIIPIKSAYVQPICRIITDFCIGDGIDYIYNVENKTNEAREFDRFYTSTEVDTVISKALEQMLAYGTSGIRLHRNKFGKIKFQSIKWTNIQKDDDGYYLVSPILYDKATYFLVERSIETQDGYKVYRSVYDLDNIERGDIYKKIHDGTPAGLSSETYSVDPIIIMTSRSFDKNGNGLPVYYHVFDKMQMIMFYDIVIGLENRDNLLSKVAVPKIFMDELNDVGKKIKDISYITHEAGDVKSYYLNKTGGYLNEALKHREILLKDIALQIGLPRDLFVTDQGSAVRVEAIRLAKQPFDKMMKYYQRLVSNAFRRIFRVWMETAHAGVDESLDIIVSEKSVIQDVSNEQQQLYLQLYDKGVLDKKTLLQFTMPDLPNKQYDIILNKANNTTE